MDNQINSVAPQNTPEKRSSYRFDIFKGVKDSTGKVHRLKSVGAAYLVDGCKTYTVYLKSFLNEIYYLLPEQKGKTEADFAILTREPSRTLKRKFFWNNVGEGTILEGVNAGLVSLEWDVFGTDDIYMSLYPKVSGQMALADAA